MCRRYLAGLVALVLVLRLRLALRKRYLLCYLTGGGAFTNAEVLSSVSPERLTSHTLVYIV
jgi:hypothetical protein